MSDKTRLNFDVAMKEGALMIRNGNVFFLGPGGSGKTHTLAALIEEEPPSIRESTSCVRKPIRTIAQCKVGIRGVHFVRINEEEYSDMLSATTKMFRLKQHNTSEIVPSLNQPRPQKIATSESASSQQPRLLDSMSSTKMVEVSDHNPDEHNPSSQINHSGLELELLHRMQAEPKTSQVLDNQDLINMRDSGGQPSFHEVLPLFVQNTTFGILTTKLNESLDSHPVVEYYRGGSPVGDSYLSPFTHLQTFRHCMRVLQSTCESDTCPKVLFIGTHKDREHECAMEESRQQKNQKLQKIIPPAMKDSIIYCDETLKELVFAVNVKTPGKKDRKMVSKVRDLMISELRKLPRRKIPLRYFALENAFLRLAKYQHKAVLSKEECFQEAAIYHFTRESFEAALRYLHGLKLIFYYEKILPNVVFIDAQTLLDKITELVEYSLSLKSASTHRLPISGALEEFKAYGIVTCKLLSQFKTHYIPDVFEEKDLILLFKYLRILAEVGEGKYLMPCLLDVKSELCHAPKHHSTSETIPALLLYFGPNGAMLGVYCCLVASLITDAKWELLSEDGHPVQVSRNQVQFRLPGDDPGTLTITDSFSTFLVVSIDFPEDIDAADMQRICRNNCPIIRETILNAVQNALHKLNYNTSVLREAFPCTKHLPTELHPAVVTKSGLLTCTVQPASVYNKLTESHKIWLGEKSYDEHQGVCLHHHGTCINIVCMYSDLTIMIIILS